MIENTKEILQTVTRRRVVPTKIEKEVAETDPGAEKGVHHIIETVTEIETSAEGLAQGRDLGLERKRIRLPQIQEMINQHEDLIILQKETNADQFRPITGPISRL